MSDDGSSSLDYWGKAGETYDGPVPPPWPEAEDDDPGPMPTPEHPAPVVELDDEEAAIRHRERVAIRADELRIVDEARDLLARQRAAAVPIPDPVTLAELLNEPDEPAVWRLVDLLPEDGRALLVAPRKTGKTTFVGNLVRALVDGEDFLARHGAEPARVALLDTEMGRRQLRTWLRDQGITNPGDVTVVPLRGRVAAFNLLDDETRARWARLLHSADTGVLVVDCLRPILDALALDEHHDAGRFLVALDALAREAGIGEVVLVHHTGHDSERARGDSRLVDWPDVLWTLTKEDPDDDRSPRYFAAFGRDVDQPEARLAYDVETRHLVVDGGTRREAADEHHQTVTAALLDYISEHPGRTTNELVKSRDRELANVGSQGARRAALTALKASGQVLAELGSNNAHRHFAAASGASESLPDSAVVQGGLSGGSNHFPRGGGPATFREPDTTTGVRTANYPAVQRTTEPPAGPRVSLCRTCGGDGGKAGIGAGGRCVRCETSTATEPAS